ncbi:MAG: glucan 1,4-alpha-glucosidase [Phycisphaerae bacterium]|nr:glucan 1,4-alpha-glucosidase [Phycisphaerae bacterium]
MTEVIIQKESKNLKECVAPGGPGVTPRWTSSAKTGVGTALGKDSRVWFTLSHGIVNEVYYPHIDKACIRDMGLIVTDGKDFFSEEKRHTDSVVHWMADGVPAFGLSNTCTAGRYHIEKQIITDPHRNTLLQHIRFTPLQGRLSDYRLYVLLAPHLGNRGKGNTAWMEQFEGEPTLFAQRKGSALALACSTAWLRASVGYVGASDGWLDLEEHRQMKWQYTRAENGNVAMVAEIDLTSSHGGFVLALGFGEGPEEAARTARSSLRNGFDKTKHQYVHGWQEWMKTRASLVKGEVAVGDLSAVSLGVLRTHESKTMRGGFIASLSIPWGFSKGDDDLSGYHLVWSRDMVEAAGALLAAGAHEEVRRALSYLQATQQADGHWPQNMWSDGTPYWTGIQMDETALPILLLDMAHRHNALAQGDMARFWPMVRQAAGYLVLNGPVSSQDRWEEDPGYTPFTVAAEIAALLAAADMADLNHEGTIATYLRQTADVWHSSIDRWIYVSGTDWCSTYKVEGYYVRIAPANIAVDGWRFRQKVHVKNVVSAEDTRKAMHLVSPDALALVRFGLRSGDDPRMADTAKMIDALLKVQTPTGPTWHRYNDDGYGEHEDGAAFDGTGIGRGWPLLTGERAHYEIAAGRLESARQLQATLESFANASGFIPEQVWDSADIPQRELYFGRPSGSAMPLVWAHAEYLKLRRSLHDGRVFDMPPQTVQRYLKEKTVSPRLTWRFNHKLRSLPTGKILRLETLVPAIIHWTLDGWNTMQDVHTHSPGLGVHLVDLPTAEMAEGQQVQFTFYWPDAARWEGLNFRVEIAPACKNGPAEKVAL